VVDPNHYFEANDPDALVSVAYQRGPNGSAGDKAASVATASLALGAVDETPSSKLHTYSANGVTFDYVAQAGHLLVSAPKTSSAAANACSQGNANPANGGPEASIFYMAYTRNDLPANQRPITFVWNGGPGEPSIWLHLGSWAPKYLAANAPNLTPGPNNIPDNFPLVDNPDTLLDQTDLVYVDIVGSGFSEAVAPYTNQDLWSTNCDAQVFRDFITAYINKNNRQSSPKYLYGESYGGIRTPIVANLLVQQGTSRYAPDPSGQPPVVLTGITLQSPILDYYTRDDNAVPTAAMTADYYGKSTARGSMSETAYANYLRSFMADRYSPYWNVFWNTDATTMPGTQLITTLSQITGLSSQTLTSQSDFGGVIASPYAVAGMINYDAGDIFTYQFRTVLYPNAQSSDISFNAYDLRVSSTNPALAVKIPNGNGNLISNYEDAAFFGAIKTHLLDDFNYQPQLPTQLYGADVAGSLWNYNHTARGTDNRVTDASLPDLVQALTLAPDLRVMVIHGYHDAVCTFYNSELDLENGGALPSFANRISIQDFDGGHMVYLTNSSRDPMRASLRTFYQGTLPASMVPPSASASIAAR